MKVVAKALIFDKDNRILVLRRSKTHPKFPHDLDFPGGGVEDGESDLLAVSREVLEECGLEIAPSSLGRAYEKEHNSTTIYKIMTVRIDELNPKIILSWEHDKYMWMTEMEILEQPVSNNLDTYFVMVLEFLKTKVK